MITEILWEIHYPATCVIELDSAYSDRAMAFFDLVAKSFIDQNIPHRFHWGKMSKLTPADMTVLYGDDVKQWLAARKQLLDLPTRQVFTNAFMESMGLTADA